MPQRIKQCAWEIYLKNMRNIYQNAALYYGIRFAFAFFFDNTIGQPFLHVLAGMLWMLALAPLDLWWRKSLLELVKGECLPPESFFSLYKEDMLCRKAFAIQFLCQGLNLWFWGIGYGISAAGENVVLLFLGRGISLFYWVTPFLLSLAAQPVYVSVLITSKKLPRLLLDCWNALAGRRGELLHLWLSLAGWLILLLASDLLSVAADAWAVSLMFYFIKGLACIVLLPYVTLCGIFFSLRVIEGS